MLRIIIKSPISGLFYWVRLYYDLVSLIHLDGFFYYVEKTFSAFAFSVLRAFIGRVFNDNKWIFPAS
jgi:hypothetical protein